MPRPSPHVSIIGHITADELCRTLDQTEASNGFGNRFLYVAAKRARFLAHGGAELDLGRHATRLQAVITAAGQVERVTRTPAANRLWERWYRRLSGARPGMLGSITARAEAQVLRLSLLYALLDGERQIDVPHLEAALAVWRYCEDSAKWVFGDSQGDPVADEILRALKIRPDGMTRSDMHGLFGRHVTANAITRALHLLYRRGLVELHKTQTGVASVKRV
jgi:hypothetical protein